MEIVLNNNIAINILVFIILPCIVLFRSKFINYNEEFLSIGNTNIIKGISVVVVILYHITLFCNSNKELDLVFGQAGFLVVAIFLFVSGYRLMIQYSKKDNYFKGFWKKIFKLYIIFIVSNIIVTVINNLFLDTNHGIKDILLSSLNFKFANGRELWFVAIIIFMYLSFYVCYKLNKEKGLLLMFLATVIYIVLCKLFGKGMWWYNTSFCFSIGILFAKYEHYIYEFYKNNYWIKLILISCLFLVTMFINRGKILQFIIPVIFIILVTMILIKIKLKSNIISFINGISFEMYLVHLVILQVAFKEPIARNSIYLVLLFPIMILVSLVIQYICKLILKICRLA